MQRCLSNRQSPAPIEFHRLLMGPLTVSQHHGDTMPPRDKVATYESPIPVVGVRGIFELQPHLPLPCDRPTVIQSTSLSTRLSGCSWVISGSCNYQAAHVLVPSSMAISVYAVQSSQSAF